MSLEGHSCWEDCDEGPHGCVCGNGCPPPGQEARDDTRYCQHGDVMIREQKPGVTTWRCPRERTCGRFEMRSESEPSREARDDEREALKAILWEWLGPIEADGDEMGAFADAILAAGYRKHPEPEITDAELIDLWWTNCADEWAVPEWVMVTFGRAVIASALRVPVKEGEQ